MRESGILMHITSLPGPYGIGTMGSEAYAFVDFLEKAGQRYWQILPLNPTGYGDSPYQAFSSQAGNPYLIDLQMLMQEGLLEAAEADSLTWERQSGRVDFGLQYHQRLAVLEKAFHRFVPGEAYKAFLEENAWWLEDYCLFAALKQTLGGTWQSWPQDIMYRQPQAIRDMKIILAETVEFHRFLQYQFFLQWERLHSYANQKGIRIIGDVPIYVPLDSAEVWVSPALFELDDRLQPTAVAGCPPDSFSATGQLWGNPLYNWQAMKDSGYDWWIRRLRTAQKLYDVIRIDHFRAFESYWSIPAGSPDARNGKWCPGPDMDFMYAIQAALPDLSCIAEDLGYVTEAVRNLQLRSGYPGMKVLQFAFDSREPGNYLPHLYPVDSVCYTGTHDNPTLHQWLREMSAEDLQTAKRYLGLNEEEGYIPGLLRGGMSSVSRLFIAQMQDYLPETAGARMNCPSTLSPKNWTWRAGAGFASDDLAAQIRKMTVLFGRLEPNDP